MNSIIQRLIHLENLCLLQMAIEIGGIKFNRMYITKDQWYGIIDTNLLYTRSFISHDESRISDVKVVKVGDIR